MGRLALLAATILTIGYGYLAAAAMSADRAATIERVLTAAERPDRAPPSVTPTVDAGRVWYGGTLPPITVTGRGVHLLEAARAPAACHVTRAI